RLAQQLREQVQQVDAARLSGDACAQLVEELAATEKACAALRARCATRVVDGRTKPAAWLSQVTGLTTTEAKAQIETSRALEDLPATRAAVDAGELSLGQAKEIVAGENAKPGCEAELLEVARSQSVGTLREKVRKLRLDSIPINELRARQVAA